MSNPPPPGSSFTSVGPPISNILPAAASTSGAVPTSIAPGVSVPGIPPPPPPQMKVPRKNNTIQSIAVENSTLSTIGGVNMGIGTMNSNPINYAGVGVSGNNNHNSAAMSMAMLQQSSPQDPRGGAMSGVPGIQVQASSPGNSLNSNHQLLVSSHIHGGASNLTNPAPGVPLYAGNPKPLQMQQQHHLAPPPQVMNRNGFTLPPGVSIPMGMDPNVLNTSDRAADLIKHLSPQQTQAALDEYADAMKVKAGKVRNAQAYLIGVIKRYVTVNSKTRKAGAAIQGDELSPVVKVTLQKLVDSGFCSQIDLGEKVTQKLKMLSEHDSLLAINEVSSVQRETIRNFPAYFMGLLNRYMRGDETPSHIRGSGVGTAPNSGQYNNNKHGMFNQGHNQNQQNNYGNGGGGRDNRRGGSGSDHNKSRRGGSGSRRSDNRYSSRGKSRSRSRSRSIDSHADDRGYHRRHSRHRRRGDSDDSRSPSIDRDRSRGRRNRSRSRSRDRYDSGRNSRDRYSSSRRRSRSRSSSPGYGRSSNGSRNRRDNDRPSRYSKHSRTGGGNIHGPIGGPVIPQHSQQPPLVQFPNSMIPPPPPPPPRNPNHQEPHMSNLQGQQQQWQPNLPQQGFAAAPGAFSHLVSPARTQVLIPSGFPQYGANSLTNPASQISSAPHALDILGIAEKAASAVQALNQIQKQPAVPAPIPAPIPVQYQMHQTQNPIQRQDPRQTSHIQHQQDPRFGSSREEDNNLDESALSPMLQYSLKNLQASGHLEKRLGSMACRLLKGMSEPAALQALERFSSCDASTFRSKEGYLIGVLKKARGRK